MCTAQGLFSSLFFVTTDLYILRFDCRIVDYESKVDARNRSHLKGRVNVASVKLEKVSKSGHGFDFAFETSEGKVFHCSVPTQMEQLSWIYFLEVRRYASLFIYFVAWKTS